MKSYYTQPPVVNHRFQPRPEGGYYSGPSPAAMAAVARLEKRYPGIVERLAGDVEAAAQKEEAAA